MNKSNNKAGQPGQKPNNEQTAKDLQVSQPIAKSSKIVIIKIARKLLNRIRFVLINQQPYEFGIVK
jgi:hypothetical protein